ncbi:MULTISPECIES: transglutaminase-like cysteine peptidase [unclassified Rhizobium]|uniref:transglutaminase-like cysteine peptidase n=1 Tax=unclassified Rhizobium TaxID=2613769 RepID=UPI000712DB2D|nr:MULTISPECIES: transglutaminase-like cysteine peptidase [unclassified Rhizobium]KQS87932.1 transglutaminase [Rhizobium sp. Leaf386]KQS94512.1 transglutaminase [Rhizobium sp. Leaf391]KQU01518.1 transglutaminase [Rhizobium sp. Leaf453]
MAQLTGIKKMVVALAAVFVSASAAIPAPNVTALSMQTGAITSQPIGHYEFCQKYRAECEIKTKSTTAPRVTDFGWSVIREVNVAVNNKITPMTDMDQFGKDEVWSYPDAAGDCEDFVLLKRKRLMEKGFSPADLLITVVRKPDGEGHAVLTVRTAQGDFILDNLDNDVKLWTKTPYRFLKRQASFNTGRWVTIENGDEVLVGSVGN